MNRPPPSPTLFPYTTLFRSRDAGDVVTSSRSGNATDARPPPRPSGLRPAGPLRSEEHTSELHSRGHLVCRLLLEKKKNRCWTLRSQPLPSPLYIKRSVHSRL